MESNQWRAHARRLRTARRLLFLQGRSIKSIRCISDLRVSSLLAKEGCRAYFSFDFLFDEKDGHIYLRELNPHIFGASSTRTIQLRGAT